MHPMQHNTHAHPRTKQSDKPHYVESPPHRNSHRARNAHHTITTTNKNKNDDSDGSNTVTVVLIVATSLFALVGVFVLAQVWQARRRANDENALADNSSSSNLGKDSPIADS